jgi:cell division cycle 14
VFVRTLTSLLLAALQIIAGKLFFMSLRDESKLRQLEEWSKRTGVKPDRVFFSVDSTLLYYPFCADFGPLSFNCVYKFCTMLNEKLAEADRDGIKVVLYTSSDPRLRTNAATLLACYLVLERGLTPEEAWEPLCFEGRSPFLTYRDATFDPQVEFNAMCSPACLRQKQSSSGVEPPPWQDFDVSILDVVRGVHKACQRGALEYAPLCTLTPHCTHLRSALSCLSVFGRYRTFNLDEYEYYDHPAVADLHVIVPGKFVAFKGPRAHRRRSSSFATLTPADYIQIFSKLNVVAVCRLNEKHYDKQDFTDAGIRHYDMYFEDCSTPSATVIEQFFEMCDKEAGTIAVHCKAGLGRTGTLICLWLMRHYGFTALEAIGYVRVMRPGSIIGPQQVTRFPLDQNYSNVAPLW